MKEAVGTTTIVERERSFVTRALGRWRENRNLQLLGNLEAPRLPIVSFVVRHGDRPLHHNLVVTLLNDLFGIQARGGCSCAGPYGHRLLGISDQQSRQIEAALVAGNEAVRPGWVRVSFTYFLDEETFRFLVAAVNWVADHGWRLQPQYRFDTTTGQWHHRAAAVVPGLSLGDVSYRNGRMECPAPRPREPANALARYLADADRTLTRLPKPRSA